MLQNKYDVVVVGGGPAGSMAAWEAAKGGVSVCMLEKDRDIGYPVRCGEAAGESGLRQFVEIEDSWIAEKITSVKLVSPNLTSVDIDFAAETGYILNRRIFDYDLAEFASIAGAQIVTKAYIDGLIIEDDKVVGVKGTHVGERFEKRAKIVVGADGVESRVGRWAGLKTTVKLKDMECGIQKTVTGIDVNEHMFDFYLSKKWAPGGYLWVFPKGKNKANIGVGISGYYAKDGKAAHKFLDEFIHWKYPHASVLTTVVGGIPVGKTVKQMVADGLMLVGDAAHTCNPLTGGGITPGMRSGLLAAETAIKALQKGGPTRQNLSSYEKEWHKIGGKNHERFYRIKESLYKLNDDELNNIARTIVAVPEKNRTLMKLFSAAVREKPSLILDVARVFAGI